MSHPDRIGGFIKMEFRNLLPVIFIYTYIGFEENHFHLSKQTGQDNDVVLF